MERSSKQMDLINDSSMLGQSPESVKRMLMNAGAGREKLLKGKGGVTDATPLSELMDVLKERTGSNYPEMAQLSSAKAAFNRGAELTGLSGAVGLGGGGAVSGLLTAAGIDPATAMAAGGISAAGLTALRAYYGPKIAAQILDAMSTAQPITQAIGREMAAKGPLAGQGLSGAVRTEVQSPEPKPTMPRRTK
jgi:hypothetical protein